MKIIILIYLCLNILNANLIKINQNISKTSRKIQNTKTKYSSIYVKMRKNAHDIFMQKKLIQQQKGKLQLLSKELLTAKQVYTQNKIKLIKLNKTQIVLKSNQQNIEQRLIFTIAKVISLSTIIDTKNEQNAQSLMSNAIIKIIIKLANKEITSLNRRFILNNKFITSTQQNISLLKNNIYIIDMKKKDLRQIKHAHENSLLHFKKDKLRYKYALEKLLNQKHALQKTLSKLNIIKINKIRLAQIEKRQQALLHPRINTKLLNVKKVGSSYKRVRTIRYFGRKTISPLKYFTISKRYGPYIDPIYKIKIFNESVSLQSKIRNAKVRTVLNGKVIFSKNTPLLKKVVIMQNAHGMHTIYANLSQIAPDVKVGRRLKESAVIGRIKHQLIFEVTQRSYHINPLELFRH